MANKQNEFLNSLLKNFAALLVAVYILSPFAWLVISSISTQNELLSLPIRWWPENADFSRFISIFASTSGNEVAYTFKYAMLNSAIIALSVSGIGLLVGIPAAYAFARLKFPGRNALLVGLLFTYMIPPVAIIIPLYLVMSKLRLMDSIFGLAVIYCTFITPFIIWIMRGYFQAIPRDLEDAARIDGCTRLTALTRVVLPLSTPGLVATGIFSFIMAWDEFFYALIFTSTIKAKTISVAIAEFSGRNAVDYGMIATGGVLAAVPPILIALFLQRYIIAGLTSGSVKG